MHKLCPFSSSPYPFSLTTGTRYLSTLPFCLALNLVPRWTKNLCFRTLLPAGANEIPVQRNLRERHARNVDYLTLSAYGYRLLTSQIEFKLRSRALALYDFLLHGLDDFRKRPRRSFTGDTRVYSDVMDGEMANMIVHKHVVTLFVSLGIDGSPRHWCIQTSPNHVSERAEVLNALQRFILTLQSEGYLGSAFCLAHYKSTKLLRMCIQTQYTLFLYAEKRSRLPVP